MLASRIMQIKPYLSPYIILKSKQIKDLNINPDTLNLLEEKMGNNLIHIGTGDSFLNRISIVPLQRSTIHKWDLMKQKSFLKGK